jgi:hypothetical protein
MAAMEVMPAMETMPAMEAMAHTEAMAPTPRVSWDGTGDKHCRQKDDAPHPLVELPSTLSPVIHALLLDPDAHHPCAGLLALSGRQLLAQGILRHLARLQGLCCSSCIACVLLYHPADRERNAWILLRKSLFS